MTRGNFLSGGENAEEEIKEHLIQNGVISFRGLSGPLFSFIRSCCEAVLSNPRMQIQKLLLNASIRYPSSNAMHQTPRSYPPLYTRLLFPKKPQIASPSYARVQNGSVSRFYSKTEQAAPSFSKRVDNQST